MIIFYFADTKKIINYVFGFRPVITTEKYVVDGDVICNTIQNIIYKYIADQRLETDENGAYLHDADYYEAFEPLPTAESRLAAIEMYLLEQELGL